MYAVYSAWIHTTAKEKKKMEKQNRTSSEGQLVKRKSAYELKGEKEMKADIKFLAWWCEKHKANEENSFYRKLEAFRGRIKKG